jgi:DNA (cytosine-5)-methyltransferase 1
MKSLELFSGAGGLAQGLSLSGFEHAKFIEFNKHACNSLRSNFGSDLVFEGDVRDFDFSSLTNIDVVAGGPPCQPFSLGGKHRAHDDNRDMFPFAIKSIRELQPKAFIFENVKGLLRTSFSEYLKYILLGLSLPEQTRMPGQEWLDHLTELKKSERSGLHYNVSLKLLNAADYGIPQTRERVFIVGIRSDLKAEWTYPEKTHSKKRLKYEQKQTEDYWERHCIHPDEEYLEQCSSDSSLDQESLFFEPLKPWMTIRDALLHLPDPLAKHKIPDHVFKGGAKSYPGHTGSFFDLPAKTLKAGVHGVPGGENMVRYAGGEIRYFTVHEAKLLQTFPPDFDITGVWSEAMRQIGNAVPVNLANVLGSQLKNVLYGANASSEPKRMKQLA